MEGLRGSLPCQGDASSAPTAAARAGILTYRSRRARGALIGKRDVLYGLPARGRVDEGGAVLAAVGHLHPGQDPKPASHGRSLASRGKIRTETREGQEQGQKCPGGLQSWPNGSSQLQNPKERALPTRAPRINLSHLHSWVDGIRQPLDPAVPSPPGPWLRPVRMGSFCRVRQHLRAPRPV